MVTFINKKSPQEGVGGGGAAEIWERTHLTQNMDMDGAATLDP